jgi:hypothetical protein
LVGKRNPRNPAFGAAEKPTKKDLTPERLAKRASFIHVGRTIIGWNYCRCSLLEDVLRIIIVDHVRVKGFEVGNVGERRSFLDARRTLDLED